jgi:ribonucleoside-diphosphate reductase beta chain
MLRDQRLVYAPFEYPEAYNYWTLQTDAFWKHTEIAMADDILDWEFHMTDVERAVVGMELKGFVQTEVIVGDYWTSKVAKWFPKPEVALACAAFGSMEGIHQAGYAFLNDTLGLTEYDAFLREPTIKAKIDRLLEAPGNSDEEVARSLAVFSGFTEGVSLFSSFAVLLNFSRRKKSKPVLQGVGQIISFSIRDESLHSLFGCWLFRKMMEEYKHLKTPKLKEAVYEAAKQTVAMEDEFIDAAFSSGEVAEFSSDDLKQFIRHRTNTKLSDLGYNASAYNVDADAMNRMSWFDASSAAQEHGDFFATRTTEYSLSNQSWDNMWA